ncbi:MAG: hypothetical protein R3220_08520 [Balneolaceae bacterium]|nr:hypothetical protein [Balneolaceae bacterium]
MSTSKEKKKKEWFGMKLTPEEKEKIRSLAKRRGVSQKQVVLDLIEKEVEKEPIKAKSGSLLDLNRDLFGVGSGSGDVSTNPKYMKGFGE